MRAGLRLEGVADGPLAFGPETVILLSVRRQIETEPDRVVVLRERPGLRLAVVQPEESAVCVYQAEAHTIENPVELIAAIRPC